MADFTNCASDDLSPEPRFQGNGTEMSNGEQNMGGIFKWYEQKENQIIFKNFFQWSCICSIKGRFAS